MRLVTEVRTRCRSRRGVIGAIGFALVFVAGTAFAQSAHSRLSRDLAALAAGDASGTARVIVDATSGDVDALAARYGGHVIRTLKRGAVVELPASSLSQIEADGAAAHVASDTPLERMMATTVVSTGADQVWAGAAGLPYTGAGIGVAIIDSGVSNHPELKGRIVASVDFLGTRGRGVDEGGHGTHVAGSVHAMAPGADIVNLRVLDEKGNGVTSDAIDAIDWVVAHRDDYNIRVINLSFGHLPVDSYADDPLCQAVERAVAAGVVVVAAAGNYGATEDGTPVVGAITSPGTDPWALTVGALNTKHTPQRSDDTIARYSSRGPTGDGVPKPDLVAPGNRIISLASPGSTLWKSHPDLRVDGPGPGYLTLSGTSMAAAVVSGAAALVLQANPTLTPFDVRVVLEQTSSFLPEAGLIEQGTGSVNALQAVGAAVNCPVSDGSLIAGERVVASNSTIVPVSELGRVIVWGSTSSPANVIVWGSAPITASVIVWGRTSTPANVIVWGTNSATRNVIVWGSTATPTGVIVWGTNEVSSDVIVWGKTSAGIRVIVWGTAPHANAIIWGTDLVSSKVIVWGSVDAE